MPLLSAAACVALADWLFYGWQVGISLALFFAVLGIVAVAGNRARATPALQAVMAAIFVAGLLALIEDVNILSTTMGALATAPFVIVITACDARSWRRDLFEAVTIPFRGPFQLAGDLIGALNLRKRQAPEWLSTSSLVAWIIPLAAFAVFLALLASARLAAFIWMVLVAVGLLLMLIQIELRKPNSWLIVANAISLAVVLYGCCFINAPRLVASYNVEHCREAGGTGPNLDLPYLASLGPQAPPSVEAHVKKCRCCGRSRGTFGTFMKPGRGREIGEAGAFEHGAWNDIWLTIPQ
jgi:hypothetical protein